MRVMTNAPCRQDAPRMAPQRSNPRRPRPPATSCPRFVHGMLSGPTRLEEPGDLDQRQQWVNSGRPPAMTGDGPTHGLASPILSALPRVAADGGGSPWRGPRLIIP